MGAYQDNLRHIAEPSSPSERDTAQSVQLFCYDALWFAEQLRDYAHYEASDPNRGIAVGLASYIDKVIRDRGESHVDLYLHTDDAVETVESAWSYAVKNTSPDSPLATIGDALDEMHDAERP